PVVEVRLMHDLRDDLDPPVLDPEAPDDRLERAVLAVMAEVGAEDVERYALAGGVGRVRERERGVRVAEALDEPCGGDAVDVGPRARDPGAAPRGKRRAMPSTPCPGRTCRGSAQALGRRLPECPGPVAGRRLEVVRGLDAVELALERVQLGAELRNRSAVIRLIAIEVPQDLPTAPYHRLV